MTEVRHGPEAPTRAQWLGPGGRLTPTGTMIIRTSTPAAADPGVHARSPAGHFRAARLFQIYPADNRTLADLGQQVGASERTLSRLFRGDLSMTFPQWRTQLRLHHALITLERRTPVTAAAHACGWASASAFIDVFRRTFGETPGAYH